MSEDEILQAKKMLKKFKGDSYAFGSEALEKIGSYASRLGKNVVIVSGKHARESGILDLVIRFVEEEQIEISDIFDGARPNTPREDVYRLAYQLSITKNDGVIVVGGGSCIDAAKAALTLATYGGLIDDYFGTGKISEKSGGNQLPLIAVQTVSSSAAHLTKYANITDIITQQKKLMVDDSIVPRASIFQYDVTKTMPPNLTKDGGLDGISHCWEVWMSSTGKSYYDTISKIAYLGIKLIMENLATVVRDGNNLSARYALGLGTDLGGYSIMMGGTNAGHLGSFSLIDILSHGRACAILNPYYTVLFSPAIQDQLRRMSDILRQTGYVEYNTQNLSGTNLGIAVAKGMIKFLQSIEFPTTLKAAGVTREHLKKMLIAAKDPQLKMKLQNMPIPMNVASGDIDKFMKPTIEAAYTGDMKLIPDLTEYVPD